MVRISLRNGWIRTRWDHVMIITGQYAGHLGTVEANVYQKTIWSGVTTQPSEA